MDLREQRFAIRWSRLTWAVTAVVWAGGAVLAVAVPCIGLVGSGMNGVSRVLFVIGPVGPIIVFMVVALFAPRAFVVRSDAIVVKRVGWDVVIPRAEIREIRRLEPAEARLAWRLFGSGGFLGFYGWYENRTLGDFWAYVGNDQDSVLITRMNGDKIVISPWPPDAFLKAVQEVRRDQ
jgi:hypothetical protein